MLATDQSSITPKRFLKSQVVAWQKPVYEYDNYKSIHEFEDCPEAEATHFTYENGLKHSNGQLFYSRAEVNQIDEVHLQRCQEASMCTECGMLGAFCHHLTDEEGRTECFNCKDPKKFIVLNPIH